MAIIRLTIQDAAITTDKIADNAITSAKIADGAIEIADLKTADDFGLITGSVTATDDYGSLA